MEPTKGRCESPETHVGDAGVGVILRGGGSTDWIGADLSRIGFKAA